MSSENRRLLAAEKRLARIEHAPANTVDFSRFSGDPIEFRREVLGFESATRRSDGSAYQDEILNAASEQPRLAIVAGHGCGKTRTLAALSLWWVATRPLSRVVIVAPQFERQVKGVIFSEIGKLVRRSRVPLGVDVQAGRVTVAGFGPEWCITGLPATEPSRIEGQHAEGGLLLVLDETKGVDQDVFDALQGALTGGEDSRLVIASTPGGPAGPFYRACADASGRWHVFRLSSEDSSLVSPQWCQDRAAEWGKDSALYQTRVHGVFADAGDGQLFSLTLLEAAVANRANASGVVSLGVDVARSVAGDENCVAIVRGGRVERFSLWRSPDLMVTVARVSHEALSAKPRRIFVDAGGVGGGVVDRLRQLRYDVEGVHFGGRANDPARFANRRAEMYWLLRERLERGELSIPDDDALVMDLAAIRYSFDQSGRVTIEAKDDARRRLGRSPDRADALVLAVAASVAATRTLLVIPISVPLARPSYLLEDDVWVEY